MHRYQWLVAIFTHALLQQIPVIFERGSRAVALAEVEVPTTSVYQEDLSNEDFIYVNLGKRVGRGIVFHITPSNVPLNFAYSWLSGILSGNLNIVRVASKKSEQMDPEQLEKAKKQSQAQRSDYNHFYRPAFILE